MQHDILLKNGTIIDPANRRGGPMDLAICKGRVSAVTAGIPESAARQVVDLGGRIVAPGLIDAHVHLFGNSWDMGVHTDRLCLPSGVTTVCDGGSTGSANFPGIRELIQRDITTRCKVFVHLSMIGITAVESVGELANQAYADPEGCARLICENRDLAVGVKLRLGPGVAWDSHGALGLARRAADLADVPLMVHVTNCPIPLPEVLAYLKPGDIVTHCYHGYPHGIFNSGKSSILEPVLDARRRGILFDSAHGRMGHFNFDVARRAIERGFLPDLITTDLGVPSATHGPVFDLATTMSKFLAMGVPLEEIILRTTYLPAKMLGLAECLGHLGVGATADVAILEILEGDHAYLDTDKNTLKGTQRIRCAMTIRQGRICYRVN